MKYIDISFDSVNKLNKRRCYKKAVDFLEESSGFSGRILTLYGLRRTGKTVLMKQLASNFGIDHIYEAEESDTMKDVYDILDKEREKNKPRMIFIDEITNVSDFIEMSALLADDYTTTGTDIIVAGTDSLGLEMAEDDALFDRIYKIPMTYIPFIEHCETLNTTDIDEYIEFGGLMRKGMDSQEAIFDYKSARRYLDSAVAQNISNSLKKSEISRHYNHIRKYTKDDLSLAINKLVEIYNGVVNEKIINKVNFKTIIGSPISDKIRRLTDADEIDRYKKINVDKLREEYSKEINLSCKLSIPATPELVEDIDYTLSVLGLLSTIKSYRITKGINNEWEFYRDKEKYIIQPAIKYYQLTEANRILMENEALAHLMPNEVEELQKGLKSDIYGRVTENIILFDTYISLGEVYKPYFRSDKNGEYDMLIWVPEENKHYAFEIKHSEKAVIGYNDKGVYIGQDKHLLNDEFKEGAERCFGVRKGAFVLYNGEAFIAPTETIYLNMVDFLKSVDKTHDINKTIADLTKSLPRKTELDLIDPNPNIHPFPVAMTGIPLECQKNLHQLILLNYNTTQPECIYTKLKRISPKLSNAINKKDVMEVVRGYKSLSSCKKMSEEFSVSTAGKEFAKQIKRGFFQA